MHFGFDIPEFWAFGGGILFWAFGGGILILLVGLAYGSWRAGWLSRGERARTDAATLELQRRESVEPDHIPWPFDYQPRASAPFGRRFPCRAVADPLVE